MRTFTAVLVASTLLVSNAFAATKSVAPLPSGKPAGVNQAAMLGPNFALILLGLGVVVGGIALAASNSGGDGVTTPTTNATSGVP
jgi:hypothetical protein